MAAAAAHEWVYDDLYSVDDNGSIAHHDPETPPKPSSVAAEPRDSLSPIRERNQVVKKEAVTNEPPCSQTTKAATTSATIAYVPPMPTKRPPPPPSPKPKALRSVRRTASTPLFPSMSEILAGYVAIQQPKQQPQQPSIKMGTKPQISAPKHSPPPLPPRASPQGPKRKYSKRQPLPPAPPVGFTTGAILESVHAMSKSPPRARPPISRGLEEPVALRASRSEADLGEVAIVEPARGVAPALDPIDAVKPAECSQCHRPLETSSAKLEPMEGSAAEEPTANNIAIVVTDSKGRDLKAYIRRLRSVFMYTEEEKSRMLMKRRSKLQTTENASDKQQPVRPADLTSSLDVRPESRIVVTSSTQISSQSNIAFACGADVVAPPETDRLPIFPPSTRVPPPEKIVDPSDRRQRARAAWRDTAVLDNGLQTTSSRDLTRYPPVVNVPDGTVVTVANAEADRVTPFVVTKVVEYYAPNGVQEFRLRVPEGRLYT